MLKRMRQAQKQALIQLAGYTTNTIRLFLNGSAEDSFMPKACSEWTTVRRSR